MNWQRLIERRSCSIILIFNRSTTFQASLAIARQMKMLNEQKQHRKVLQLFDSYRKNPSAPLAGMMINQALKACTQTRDLKRGTEIHREISSQVTNDPYVTASLVLLYGA